MKNEPMSDQEYRTYLYALGKTFWRKIELEWNEWLIGEGLSISEHSILTLLYEHQELTITKLSELGLMHISTALNFSKKLEKKGYLSLQKQVGDRRVTYAHLTELGIARVEEIEANWQPENSSILQETNYIEKISGVKPNLKVLEDILYMQGYENIQG